MKWRVVWTNRAVAGLTAAYLDLRTKGLDAGGVARAAAELDEDFVRNPADLGESRWENVRVVFRLPLVVYFEAHAEEQIVVVTTLRWSIRA